MHEGVDKLLDGLPMPTMAIGSGHCEGDGSFPKTLVVAGKPGIAEEVRRDYTDGTVGLYDMRISNCLRSSYVAYRFNPEG